MKLMLNTMYDLLLKLLSKHIPCEERGFYSYSPSLAGKGLGVRFSLLNPLCLGMLVSLAVMGCTPDSPQGGNNPPQVVATSTIIADLAEEIGGEKLQITGILKPGADPHVYEPVPADSRVLEKANLILYNGYNLEPGIIKLMNATGDKAKKLAVGEVVKSLKLDKGQGKIVPDPHVWGSAENVILMVKAIKNSLKIV
ncbi:MAG: Manganese transporter substrate-binding lipoprotein [Cyanobacteriota bacterium]